MFGKNLPFKEKLRAAGAFGGIAVASVMALDMMITGGYQMPGLDDLPSLERDAPAGQQVLDVIDGGWRSDYATSPVAWTDPLPMNDIVADTQDAVEQLAGGEPEGYRDAMYDVPDEDALYREITALYARQDEQAAARAEANAERTQTAEERAEVSTIEVQLPAEESKLEDETVAPHEESAPEIAYEDAPIAYEDAEPIASETE